MTPESHTHSEPHRTGHRWIDISVAACALVVSITSLVVAIRHGRTMEHMADANARLVSANSWPLLQRYFSDVGTDGSRVTSLVVVNAGVGPAKVEALELRWKGRAMHSPDELIRACCEPPGSAYSSANTSDVHGMVLRAGATVRLYELPESAANAAVVARLREVLADLDTHACYCSVFDECWASDLRTLHPQRVARCEAPQVAFRSH